MSLIFGFAPTKIRIFKALKDEQTDAIEIEEIHSKGASDQRLKDYGITQESVIFFVPTNENDFTLMNNLRNTVKFFLRGSSCSVKKGPEEIEMQDLKNYGYSTGAVGSTINTQANLQ
jgi:hypothetical protein